MKKTHTLLMALLVFLVSGGAAFAEPRLDISISPAPSFGSAGVKISIRNSGNEPAYIPTQSLFYYITSGGDVLDNYLVVKDTNGRPADFTGRLTDRVATATQEFEIILVNKQKDIFIDVAKSYVILPSTIYSVNLPSELWYLDEENAKKLQLVRLQTAVKWNKSSSDPAFISLRVSPPN